MWGRLSSLPCQSGPIGGLESPPHRSRLTAELDSMHPCPCDDVFQNKVKQIVALENVRVEPNNSLAQSLENLLFAHLRAEEDFRVTAIVHQGNGENAVFLSLRIGKLKPRSTTGFNVDGKPMEVVENKPFELEKTFLFKEQKWDERFIPGFQPGSMTQKELHAVFTDWLHCDDPFGGILTKEHLVWF
jgi:hypothetical protein